MKKPWSISTTVRNAKRIKPFLEVLKKIEGDIFDEKIQVRYQTLLIQHKLYQPIGLSRDLIKYYQDIKDEMSYKSAEKIFNFMLLKSQELRKDSGLRGRTSVAPLSKMGLCITKRSVGKVKITNTGKSFLENKTDIGELFFKFFLKWQYPNPDSTDFRKDQGFDIKPFIGFLHLINQVNDKWVKFGDKPVGINKEEFSLFVPTLINYKDISKQVDRLIDFRSKIKKLGTFKEKREFKNKFKRKFASEFLGTNNRKKIKLLLSNLKDYGDNAIRYFRLTRYIYIRGGGFYIDLEPRRKIEIDKLLKSDNASSLNFKNLKEYLLYIADLKKPELPWETEIELKKIAIRISNEIQNYVKILAAKNISFISFRHKKIENLNKNELKNYIEDLRLYRQSLQNQELYHESQSVIKIQEYIDQFKNIFQSQNKKSIELEKLTKLALNSINDALEIKANYPVGDDNQPTFTAPANKPDIECYYNRFNSVCEVTMLSNRSQWYNEGQPVMRHVRDFEKTYPNKKVYCLFIAPRIHQDTAETFWMAIKYGYKGAKQRIVPLSLSQFIKLIEILLRLKKQGKRFKHSELLELYDRIIELTKNVNHSDKWIESIPKIFSSWENKTIAQATT